MFLVFINHLHVPAELLIIVRKFADTGKLGQVTRTDQDQELLQASPDKLITRAETWGMSYNVKKCMVIQYGHNNPKKPYFVKRETLLTTKETGGDTGILMSDNLKPPAHCARAAKTAGAVLGQLNSAFNIRD